MRSTLAPSQPTAIASAGRRRLEAGRDHRQAVLVGILLAGVSLLLSDAATAKVGAEVDVKVKVVTTLETYAALAREVGGDRVEVSSISRSDEDAHFVKPKPSYALMLKDADLLVSTGLDLELWVPVLVDKSGNRRIREGQPGFVNASAGVVLRDIPTSADRSAGDVHIYGNPHITTNPINAKVVAGNVAAGLIRVDPDGAAEYNAHLAAFHRGLDEALYGAELVAVLGSETLDSLALQGKLIDFLREQEYQGKPLVDLLGGWLRQALPLRGLKIVAYHKNWIYLTSLFGIEEIGYVEPKPGIPPSARHVHELIHEIRRQEVRVLLAASYFSAQQVSTIAERTGCNTVRIALGPTEGLSYSQWMDELVGRMTSACCGG